MLKKLRTVIYKTADLTAAKRWYERLTGLQPYFDQPFYVGFDVNGCELGLDPDMNNVSTGNQAVAYWSVDNLQERLIQLAIDGATIVQPRTNVGGDIHVAVIQDPFGNQLGLIEGA